MRAGSLSVPERIAAMPPSPAVLQAWPVHVAVTGLVMTAGLAAIAARAYEPESSYAVITASAGLGVAGLVLYARYCMGLAWLSASVVYLILFWIFHFGLTFTAVLVPSVLDTRPDFSIAWLSLSSTRMSMLLALIGAAAFVCGTGVAAAHAQRRRRGPSALEQDGVLYGIGWVLLLAGSTAALVVVIQNGGTAVFSIGYLAVLQLGASTMFSSGLRVAQAGGLLAVCGAGDGRWLRPLMTWAVLCGLPVLLLGIRTDALVPAVTFALVLAHRGVRFPRGIVLAGSILTLFLIPAVNAFRQVGFANREDVSWTAVTPLDTLVELGSSLRATRAYVDWIQAGDPLLLGASYWNPLDRQLLARVIPGREQIPYDDDTAIPLRLMDEREGPIGGSATGEAYYNFGVFGLILYFGAVGLLFGWLERVATTGYGAAILGAVAMPFYFNIRSEWLPVPAKVATVLLAVWCCRVIAGLLAGTRPGRAVINAGS